MQCDLVVPDPAVQVVVIQPDAPYVLEGCGLPEQVETAIKVCGQPLVVGHLSTAALIVFTVQHIETELVSIPSLTCVSAVVEKVNDVVEVGHEGIHLLKPLLPAQP